MLQFQLFRLNVQWSYALFEEDITSINGLLKAMIAERPSLELRNGVEWHVGNVQTLEENVLQFAIGKLTKSLRPQFDEVAQDFVEQEFEEAPYTVAFLDQSLEVLAIAHKSKLGNTTSSIAKRLEKLMQGTVTAGRYEVSVKIDPIANPNAFLDLLHSAHAVEKFKVSFGLPNPWDTNKDINEPLEKALRDLDGKNGNVEFSGEHLDVEKLEDITRSAAATSQSASARMRITPGSPRVTRKLSEKNVVVNHPEPIEADQKISLIDAIRSAYRQIRGNQQ